MWPRPWTHPRRAAAWPQRETLLRSRSTLKFASDGLESSGRILRTMARRAATNKLVLYIVIAVIVALILMLLYSSVASPADAAAAPTTGAGGDWKRTSD